MFSSVFCALMLMQCIVSFTSECRHQRHISPCWIWGFWFCNTKML